METFEEHNDEAWGEDGPNGDATAPQKAELEAAMAATIEAWNLRHQVYRAWVLDIQHWEAITAPGGEREVPGA